MINAQRSALEVFVNKFGTITIRQADDSTLSTREEPTIVVHPDDVSLLVWALDRARRQAGQMADEFEELMVPDLYSPRRTGSA